METKFKLVETEEYTLAVSDEDASNSYIYFTGDPTGIFKTGIKYKNEAGDYFYQDAITGMSDTYLTTISKKIIAYKPKGNAPELDLPLLPEIVVEDDVEKLAEISSELQEGTYTPQHKITYKHGFIDGYKTATKVYSEDDLRKAIHFGKFGEYEGIQKTQEFIQSLKQLKWFVAEMKHTKSEVFRENDNVPYAVLKTTTINNKTYLVGTYLN
jgi:hypothetical protein